ncbi:hypothetical protein [Dactylosporangium sp. NPDC000521]|uniref:hypothetical protein n=1 Tax=Dactylosporangium sp. NPDC000521 TaxID=3363975 RepID=UPI0036792501
MRMTSEPPAEYVAFVSRHLEPLRRDAVRVVGAETDADHLYGDVLTDVATRWSWLELQRTRLGHEGAADDFLGRVFARRSERWFTGEDAAGDDDHEIQVTAWYPDEHPDQRPPARRVYVSNAVRLAPMLVPRRRSTVFVAGPACEAAIAWWHAYETIRRRRLAYLGFVAIVLLLALASVSSPPPA